MEGSYKYTK